MMYQCGVDRLQVSRSNTQALKSRSKRILSGKAAELRRTIEKLQEKIHEQKMHNKRLQEQHASLLNKMEVRWRYAKSVPLDPAFIVVV